MEIREYKPYRIMHDFTVPGKDEATLESLFPNGKIKKKGKQFIASYKSMSVVDRPSAGEIGVFNNKRKKINFALIIPQDGRGFDTRTSGLARSVKTSKAARKNAMIEIARDKHLSGLNLPAKVPVAKPVIPPDAVFSPPVKKVDEVPKIIPKPESPIVKAQAIVKSNIEAATKTLVEDADDKKEKDLESQPKEEEVKPKSRRPYSRRKPIKTIKPEPAPEDDNGKANGFNTPKITSEMEDK